MDMLCAISRRREVGGTERYSLRALCRRTCRTGRSNDLAEVKSSLQPWLLHEPWLVPTEDNDLLRSVLGEHGSRSPAFQTSPAFASRFCSEHIIVSRSNQST